ncbi:MAG: methyltransferase [Sphingobium sp.]
MKMLPRDAPGSTGVYRVADLLYRHGARAVWLFGSRASPRQPDKASDFDIAVEGMDNPSAFTARAARFVSAKLDLVRLESTNAFMRERIMKYRLFVPHVEQPADRHDAPPVLPASLQGQRIAAVAGAVRDSGARSLIDFGCGDGMLLAQLASDRRIARLTGVDFSPVALNAARGRLRAAVGHDWANRIALHEALVTWRDPMFADHEAASAIEVIEHMEAPQLAAFAAMLFGFVRPRVAILTTPNSEYNVVWHGAAVRRRHHDHRFEWTRAEFRTWAARMAARHGYGMTMSGIGEERHELGHPTMMAVFRLQG